MQTDRTYGAPQGAVPPPEGVGDPGPQHSSIIAKAAAKNKFLDFRNNLVPAWTSDYAMVHGIGGGKHAARSTIKLYITDYSAGAGNSTVVSANVGPDFIAYLAVVCEKNAGIADRPNGDRPGQGSVGSVIAQIRAGTLLPAGAGPNCSSTPVLAVPAELVKRLSQECPPELAMLFLQLQPFALPSDGSGTDYVAVRQDVVELMASMAAQKKDVANGMDFFNRQERVNVYRKEDGLVPVSVLTIARTGKRKDGSISRMPWSVKIQNFRARPIDQENGTTSYDPKSIQESAEAFVMLSDYDMFRCTYRVTRFIELWEMAVGLKPIKDALAVNAANRQNRH